MNEEDPQDATSSRIAGNNANAITQNNVTSATVSTSVSSSAPPSASASSAPFPMASLLDSTFANLHQVLQTQAQATPTSTAGDTLDTISFLQQLQQMRSSGQQPRVSGLAGYSPLVTATSHAQQPTPAVAAASSVHQLARPLTQNQTSLPPIALPAGLASYLAPTWSTPTNQLQQLLRRHLTPQSSVASMPPPTQSPSNDQPQLLHQLIQEIRSKIQVVAVILSQHHQAGSIPSPASDATINQIIAILWQEQQAGVPNNPSSNSDTINRIVEFLMLSSTHQQHQPAGGDGFTNNHSSTSRSTASTSGTYEMEQLLQSMRNANGSTVLNHQYSSGASTNQIAQLLLSQQANSLSSPPRHSTASSASTNQRISQLLSQQVAPSQLLGSTMTNQTEQLIQSMVDSANHHASNHATDFASVNQANATLAVSAAAAAPHEGGTLPKIEMAERFSTDASAAPHQSIISNQEDNKNVREMKPNPSKEERWNARYEELKKFQQQHGHCRVPHGYAGNRKLSWWVMNQRAQYQLLRQGKSSWLTEDRVELLREIGFDWSPIQGKHKAESDGQKKN